MASAAKNSRGREVAAGKRKMERGRGRRRRKEEDARAV